MHNKQQKEHKTNTVKRYKVSVIVPCYNIVAYLDQCLESLINQTLKSIEIIAINDGSTDNTGSKLDDYQSKYPNKIKVVHHLKNLGLSASRNTGLIVAQGECIGFVDADDYVDRAMYKKLYDALIINNADISSCEYLPFTDDKILKLPRSKLKLRCKPKTNILPWIHKGVAVWRSLYKAKFLVHHNIKFIEEILFAEDQLFTYDIIKHSPKLICLEDKLYFYRHMRSGQLTSLFNKKVYQMFEVFAYLTNNPATHYTGYKLINNFFLYEKINYFFNNRKKLDIKYRFDFFVKAAYALFANTKATTIYKVLLISKYRKLIDYFRVPIYVVIAHIYYLLDKFIIAKYKQSLD